MPKFDGVTIVGGGVIGLLTALNLAPYCRKITILDRAEIGRESSWAGGGIISPLYPWRYHAAVTALAQWSQDFYPRLSSQLLMDTGIDIEVYKTGLYWLDLDDEAEAMSWAEAEHRNLIEADISDVRKAVPALGGNFTRALSMPDLANVRNPRLIKSLKTALQKLPNVTLREHCEISEFIKDDSRIIGVSGREGIIYSDHVIITSGAWSGNLLASLSIDLPVAPVKGQMLLYKCHKDFLTSMVLAKGRYAIPRSDGHILIGSTLEYQGFDKTPTVAALESLKHSAIELIPALENVAIVGHWAGLRPGSPDGVPLIGAVPEIEGLWVNCGHFRNGLVLAPASCRLLADLMLRRPPIVDPTPYIPLGKK